jgi:predicted nucleic acid-binding protein
LIAILVDTSFLISFADPNRKHHAIAVQYFREALRLGAPLYLSVIAISEFQVKQAVDDLPMRNFEVLPFNHDHAVKAGLLMRDLHHDAGDNRQGVKDDIKLIAQADCESLTHILTEDAQSLVKYLRRFNDAGRCQVKSILLADGFDAAWFNNGQRGLPGT